MNVCIIGGSFDPIHMGHLQMARSAQAHCMADEVWFLPAGDPWQKKGQVVADGLSRAHMVGLAIAGVHSWRVESCEIKHKGPTYTAETLQNLGETYPLHRFVFVVGSDQLGNLTSWKHWRSLFDYARIGVVDRGTAGAGFKVADELKHFLMRDQLFRIPMPEVRVSSTEIRRMFESLGSDQEDIRSTARQRLELMLPTNVYKYLQEHPVYGRFD